MSHCIFPRWAAWAGLLAALAVQMSAVSGQAQCGRATWIDFPVDPAAFTIVQDFAAQSPRHQGRFHSGEDWFTERVPQPGSSRGTAVGEYVRAAADGQVVLSSPAAWGADGGVIILRHTMPDDSTAHTMYGHLTEAAGIAFPAAYTCVRQGDVLATIADVRPAPHLHFEVRVGDNITAGSGYVWLEPGTLGLRRPSKFIRTWQTRLNDAYLWQADFADERGPAAPPVRLEDGSLLLLDAADGQDRVLRLSPDGRVLWRIVLDQRAAGLVPTDSTSADIYFEDGAIQRILQDGSPGERFSLNTALDSPPISAFNRVLFHTPDDRLLAVDAASRTIVWALDQVAPVISAAANNDQAALVTQDAAGHAELLTIRADGTLLDRAFLTEPASVALDQTGALIVFARGGLWTIDLQGLWSPLSLDVQGGASSAVAVALDGTRVLFDGTALTSYAADGTGRWQALLDQPIDGSNQLAFIGEYLLLTSSSGAAGIWRASGGAECARLQLWGGPSTGVWHAMDGDGVLRLWVGDQLFALDWDELTAPCR
jgi:hypothetical protein